MWLHYIVLVTLNIVCVTSQPPKCDHTPAKAKVTTPSDLEHTYHLSIETKSLLQDITDQYYYVPDQTYVVTLSTSNDKRPFKWFLISAEDPGVDDTNSQEDLSNVDVGTLKPLKDQQSRYNEKCAKTVQETDNSDKTKIEVHWISPKHSNRKSVRLRAMVAENEEVWFSDKNLELIINKNDLKPIDSPPDAIESCNLCTEARYEVTFQGLWSRLTHPQHYPNEPDTNGYSDMIGASHEFNFVLWKLDREASPGLKLFAEDGDITIMQRDIINNMSMDSGVRTLIKGKGHMHPHMHEESYALFRVDRIHHLFSLVVKMKPSPDWFLGTSMFELCSDEGWLNEHELLLLPWDAGTANGISYDSTTSVTQPVDTVQRVQVGSFDEASPFYQMNFNDLKPFARLKVRLLDEYDIGDEGCSGSSNEGPNANKNTMEDDSERIDAEQQEDPTVAEFRGLIEQCEVGPWGDWTPCELSTGTCGVGLTSRTRIADTKQRYRYFSGSSKGVKMINECKEVDTIETKPCHVECEDIPQY